MASTGKVKINPWALKRIVEELGLRDGEGFIWERGGRTFACVANKVQTEDGEQFELTVLSELDNGKRRN